MDKLQIRLAGRDDLEQILEIYRFARETMKKNGNPTQWGNHRPSKETVIQDIAKEQSYVIYDGKEIFGVFVLVFGEEPTYQVIEDGAWLNDEAYGTIHRIASNEKRKGVLKLALDFCESQIENIRIDTHENNTIMQHLLKKYGYKKCGRIYVEDGSPRIAYQK